MTCQSCKKAGRPPMTRSTQIILGGAAVDSSDSNNFEALPHQFAGSHATTKQDDKHRQTQRDDFDMGSTACPRRYVDAFGAFTANEPAPEARLFVDGPAL